MEDSERKPGGLGVFLPEPAHGIVNVWRRRYDPSYKLLGPHISIAFPPFIPPEKWHHVRPVLLACLTPFKPFRVTLTQVGMFTGNPLVLWLKPEDGGILARMRKALEEALPDEVPELPFTYRPHVSIGFFQDIESLLLAHEQVKKEMSPIDFWVDEVCYGIQESDSQWQVYDRIKLEGDPIHGEAH